MKKTLFPLGIVVLLFSSLFVFQSCKKIVEAAEFDVDKDLPQQRFVLDSASTKGEEVILYESFFDIDLDKILEDNGIDKGKIKDGKISALKITIDEPTPEMEEVGLGFVSSLRFVVSEESDYAVEEQIAEAKDIQQGDQSIVFKMNDKYLDKYLELSKFYFRLYGVKESEIPVEEIALLLDSRVKFTVSPLN
jgi:hypothetical protein